MSGNFSRERDRESYTSRKVSRKRALLQQNVREERILKLLYKFSLSSMVSMNFYSKIKFLMLCKMIFILQSRKEMMSSVDAMLYDLYFVIEKKMKFSVLFLKIGK